MESRHYHLGVLLLFVVSVPDVAQGDLVPLSHAAAEYIPIMVAGAPPDTPAARIDANTMGSAFSGVGNVFADPPGPSGSIGTGTPISPFHILTAAHVIDTDADGVSNVSAAEITFRLNFGSDISHTLSVSSFVIHPDFTGFNNPVVNDDLAILTLTSPLPVGVPIYPLHMSPLAGLETLIFAGYGTTGDGVTGYVGSPSFTEKRTGQNVFNLADDDDEGSGDLEVFAFDFDGPDVTTNKAGGLTLGNTIETNFGGGDSGGPAFIDVGGGVLELAGVNTFVFPFIGGPAVPLFGSGGGGMLIEPYLPWIASVTAVPEAGAMLSIGAVALGSGAVCWIRSRLQQRRATSSGIRKD